MSTTPANPANFGAAAAQNDLRAPPAALSAADAIPFPPRYWWLKRILCVGAVSLAALLGLRLWWGWHAHRRLQAEIDKYVAAGEPIYIDAFQPKPIPDAENAARLYEDAFAAITLTPEDEALIGEVAGEADLDETQLAVAEQMLARNAKVLALVREARSRTKCDWGTQLRSPVVFTMFGSLSPSRSVSKMLSVRVAAKHASGDHRECVEALLDGFAMSRAVSADPFLLNVLVAIATDALMSREIEGVAHDLQVGSNAPGDGQSVAPADRALVEALIRELVDDSVIRNRLRRGLLAERMSLLDTIKCITDGRMSGNSFTGAGLSAPGWIERAVGLPILPIYHVDGLRCLRETTELIDGVDAAWAPRGTEPLPLTLNLGGLSAFTMDWLLRPLSSLGSGWLERCVALAARVVAQRRMAGTVLAIRLYELDHGRRPKTLAELVPAYLETIPADPFSPDGNPLGYLPDAEEPMVYTVADDGVDNGGVYGDDEDPDPGWDAPGHDFPFFLNGNRPEPPEDEKPRAIETPTDVNNDGLPEIGEDDDDVEDSGGQSDADESDDEEPEDGEQE